jgi:hypothetical protein
MEVHMKDARKLGEGQLNIKNWKTFPLLVGYNGRFETQMVFGNLCMNRSLALAFSNYAIESGQFGLSVPTGIPILPEGGLLLVMTLSHEKKIEVGEYSIASEATRRLAHYALFQAKGRINPLGDLKVYIHDLQPDFVEGEILEEGQSYWPSLVGRFRAALV